MDPFGSQPLGSGATYAGQNVVMIQTQIDQGGIIDIRSDAASGRDDSSEQRYIFGPSKVDGDTDIVQGEFVCVVSALGRGGGYGVKDLPYPLVRSSLNGFRTNARMPADKGQRDRFQISWVRDNVSVIGISNTDRKVASRDGSDGSPNFATQVAGTAMVKPIEPIQLMDPIEILPATFDMMKFTKMIGRGGVPATKRGLYARRWKRPQINLKANIFWTEQLSEMAKYHEMLYKSTMDNNNNIDDNKLASSMKAAPFPVDRLDSLPTEEKTYLLMIGALERIFKRRMKTFSRYKKAPGAPIGPVGTDMKGNLGNLFNQPPVVGAVPVTPGDLLTVPLSGEITKEVYSDELVRKDVELIVSACMGMFQASTRNVKGVSLDSKSPAEQLRMYLEP